jgi:hypothetical protein
MLKFFRKQKIKSIFGKNFLTYRRVLPAIATIPSGHCSDAKPDACSRDS